MIKRLWLMVLCCLIPVAAILTVRYMGWNIGGWSGLLVLLCPVSHLVMMFFMRPKSHKSENAHENHIPEKAIETVKEQAASEFPGKFNL